MNTWLRYGMIALAALAVLGLQSSVLADAPEQTWGSDPGITLDDDEGDPPAKAKDKAKKKPKAKAEKKAKAKKKKADDDEPPADEGSDDEEY